MSFGFCFANSLVYTMCQCACDSRASAFPLPPFAPQRVVFVPSQSSCLIIIEAASSKSSTEVVVGRRSRHAHRRQTKHCALGNTLRLRPCAATLPTRRWTSMPSLPFRLSFLLSTTFIFTITMLLLLPAARRVAATTASNKPTPTRAAAFLPTIVRSFYNAPTPATRSPFPASSTSSLAFSLYWRQRRQHQILASVKAPQGAAAAALGRR